MSPSYVNRCASPSAQMHEIGHNLGLRHSNEDGNTYADQTGMMGYSYPQENGPAMCFNNAKNWQFGWYENRHTTVSPLTDQHWNGELVSYVDYLNSAGKTVVLKVEGHTRDYFIGFNRKAGINSGNMEEDAVNKVTIHSVGTSGIESELEAKLGIGGSFEIPDFGGGVNSVLIEVGFIDMTSDPPIAEVSVVLWKCTSNEDCDDGSACTTNTCNVSQGTCIHEPNDSCLSSLKMVLLTDKYPSETSWVSTNIFRSVLYCTLKPI